MFRFCTLMQKYICIYIKVDPISGTSTCNVASSYFGVYMRYQFRMTGKQDKLII